MQLEIWADIPEYKGYYQISNYGNVKSLDRYVKSKGTGLKLLLGKVKNKIVSHDGYYKVRLSKYKITKDIFVHRLVALAFIPIQENKLFVNHKNGNRKDNYFENLEWCTLSENAAHGFTHNRRIHPNKGKCGKLHPRSIPIIAINRFTGEEKEFESINLAALKLNLNWSCVHKTLMGKYKYSGDYYFMMTTCS